MIADLFGENEERQMGDKKPASGKSPGGTGGKVEMRFEEAFARLEELVSEMERGDLPLEDLLDRFEEGVGLVRRCQKFLKDAQLRVKEFVEEREGQWVLKDFEE